MAAPLGEDGGGGGGGEGAGGGDKGDEELPRDAKLVRSILRSMGVKQHEPRVVHQFLDFCYRYVAEVLGDAHVYSEHASKPFIDGDDIKLAIQSRIHFSQPPPRETFMELARVRNSIPLPKAISGPGMALPPEADTLTAPNYQIAVPMKSTSQAEDMEMMDEEDGNHTPTTATTTAMEKNGMPPPGSQQGLEQDNSKKVSFSLAGKRPRS